MYRSLVLGLTFCVGVMSVAFRKQSSADLKFYSCCAKEVGADHSCTRELCRFERMTPFRMITYGVKCLDVASQIWNCSSGKRDHRPCCTKKGVLGPCLNYCNGEQNLNLKMPNFMCMMYFNPILQCFKEERV